MGCSWIYVARKLNNPYKSDNYPGFNHWIMCELWGILREKNEQLLAFCLTIDVSMILYEYENNKKH